MTNALEQGADSVLEELQVQLLGLCIVGAESGLVFLFFTPLVREGVPP